MLIVDVYVESGCSFEEDEFNLLFNSAVFDTLDLRNDIEKIEECIIEHVHNEGLKIKEEIYYSFFLNRANIATAFPGYEPAFDVQQVLEDIREINIQL